MMQAYARANNAYNTINRYRSQCKICKNVPMGITRNLTIGKTARGQKLKK